MAACVSRANGHLGKAGQAPGPSRTLVFTLCAALFLLSPLSAALIGALAPLVHPSHCLAGPRPPQPASAYCLAGAHCIAHLYC
jgi:hypothetical protein